MVENSCCKELFEKCAGNPEEQDIIKKSRKALIDFGTKLACGASLPSRTPEELEYKKAYMKTVPVLAAKEAVINLNNLCEEKNTEPVFKGSADDIAAVYRFAETIIDEILADMQNNLGKKA